MRSSGLEAAKVTSMPPDVARLQWRVCSFDSRWPPRSLKFMAGRACELLRCIIALRGVRGQWGGEILQLIKGQNLGWRFDIGLMLLAAQFQCVAQGLDDRRGGQPSPNIFPILIRKPPQMVR